MKAQDALLNFYQVLHARCRQVVTHICGVHILLEQPHKAGKNQVCVLSTEDVSLVRSGSVDARITLLDTTSFDGCSAIGETIKHEVAHWKEHRINKHLTHLLLLQ